MTDKQKVTQLLKGTNVRINGKNPWDIQVHDDRFYSRVLKHGVLGLGESYMEGMWDCDDLAEFFNQLARADLRKAALINRHDIWLFTKSLVLNMQKVSRSTSVAEQHYDLGNDFYEDMLDKDYMQYTCAYWKNAKTLAQAQKNKLDLVCKKLKLKKGERVLELGGGWGGFARFAAKNYGVHVTSYNISKEQVAYAKSKSKGLKIDYKLQDYRKAKGKFDKVVSIGMCEHVGYKNYADFFKLIHDCLAPNGLALVHTIGANKSGVCTNPWTDKYIFPNGMLPSISQLSKAFQSHFVMEDWHNLGPNYDKTLCAWNANFEKNWKKWSDQYGEKFFRMWRYYLLQSAGGFRARNMQLWQVVLSKRGGVDWYDSVR